MYHTCHSINVCSNRGPVIATARSRWLRAHGSARLGACFSTCRVAASGVSCRAASCSPIELVGTALVSEMEVGSLGGWVLVGMGFSVRIDRRVEDEVKGAASTTRLEERAASAHRRDRVGASIVAGLTLFRGGNGSVVRR